MEGITSDIPDVVDCKLKIHGEGIMSHLVALREAQLNATCCQICPLAQMCLQ